MNTTSQPYTPPHSDDQDVIDVAENEIVIHEDYVTLPEDIATTLSDHRLKIYTMRIGEAFRLTDTQNSLLFFTIEKVLSGALPYGYFPYFLSRVLGTPEDISTQIATRIQRELFSPVAQSLQYIQESSPLPSPEKIFEFIKRVSGEDDGLTDESLLLNILSLPKDIQGAIFSEQSSGIYTAVSDRYGLDGAQRELLVIQTDLLLMGNISPKEYVLVLAEKLGIPRDKAAFIAQEVNRNILHGVRESLKEIHQITPPQEAQAQSTVEMPVPPVPRPPSPTPAPTMAPSTFDQKLGSTFRVATLPQAGVPSYGTPTPPVPVIPPPTPVPPQAPRANDPYRESPL